MKSNENYGTAVLVARVDVDCRCESVIYYIDYWMNKYNLRLLNFKFEKRVMGC